MGKKMNKAENGEEDFPQEEENGDGSDEEPSDDDEIANSLQKQLASLQKQIDGLDISKAVKNESENRLRKMGFKEENGLQKPQLSKNVFGADETPIKKAQTVNDVVDQLTNLSYKELRKMQEYKRQGLTEGLPDEIANL
jgi:predicted metal-dependent hydrolase